MPKLPPVMYSKIERFLICNKVQIWCVIYVLVFIVLPVFFWGDEVLDSVLVDGIASEP